MNGVYNEPMFGRIPLGGYEIVPSVRIRRGYWAINDQAHQILVNPASIDEFANLLKQNFEDEDGHKVFSI